MKKKNKTKDIIIVMVVLALVISIVLVVVNIMAAQSEQGQQDVSSKRVWAEVSDNVKYMAASADMQVKYISSDKRTVIFFIGEEKYFGLRYNNDQKMLFIHEGTYTASATTDELKLNEATSAINGNGSYEKYAENVSVFSVSGASNQGFFDSGTMKILLAVDGDVNTRQEFEVEVLSPNAENAAE